MSETDSLSKREKIAFLEDLRGEFSTPLEVIVGYVELLIDSLREKPSLEYFKVDLQKILAEGQYLQREVDEVFNLAILQKSQKTDITEIIRTLEHKLLTPLNSIIGYCELLFEDEFSLCGQEMENDLRTIHEAAQLFIGYIHKISTVAQTEFEGGNLVSHFEQLSLIVRNVVTSIPPLNPSDVFSREKKDGTILIIDNNKMELDLLVRIVQSYGYLAVPCENSEKVFDLLENHNIDMILLQIILGKVSGYEILKQLKKSKDFTRLPIMVISPLKEYDAAVRCYELGTDDYLTKPFSSVILKAKINNYIEKKKLLDKEKIYLASLKEEKEKSEALLLNILPVAIADRLKKGEKHIVDRVDRATILFTDIVNFTALAEKLTSQELIDMLNRVFSMIDRLIDKYGVEKIKTIGDSYMAVAGVPIPSDHHAEQMADVALGILSSLSDLNRQFNYELQMRIGLHSGPLIAGVIGSKKFIYDLWGKSVNFASRMESNSVPGKIQVSQTTYDLLKDIFIFEEGRKVTLKGIGEVSAYFLISRKS